MDENLNIEYHVRRLVLIALGKFKTRKEAAQALGITPRTLARYQKKFNYPKQEHDNRKSEPRQSATS